MYINNWKDQEWHANPMGEKNWIPRDKTGRPIDIPQNRERKIKCSKCGVELGEIAYYSCPNTPCPIQMKPSF